MSNVSARRQIRLAVLDAVQTVAGLNIESPGAWDVPPRALPAVRVRAPSDKKRGLGKAPPMFTTTVVVDVQFYAQATTQEDVQDQGEAYSELLEQAVLSYGPLLSLCRLVSEVSSDVDVIVKGNVPLVKIDISFAFETTEEFVSDGPFVSLQQIAIHFDARTVAVDPAGTYPFPAFPAEVTPAPRTTGPDGRDEGFLLLDMVTGLPVVNQAPRFTVSGNQCLSPTGRSLDTMGGWNWGREQDVTEQDAIDAIAQGAAIIRIPFRFSGFYPPGGGLIDVRDDTAVETALINPARLTELDARIKFCNDRDIPWILFVDSDCMQNGTQPDDYLYCCQVQPNPGQTSDWPQGRNALTDPVQRGYFKAVWRFLANKYKFTKGWALAELMPEVSWPSGTDADTEAWYAELAAEVRLACSPAPNPPFLVGATTYSIANCKAAYHPEAIDYVYTGNAFLHVNGLPDPISELRTRIAKLVSFRVTKNVPIFIQQIGRQTVDDLTGNPYLAGLCDAWVEAACGGTYWTYRDGFQAGGFGVKYLDNQGATQTKTAEITLISGVFAALAAAA